MLIEPLDHCGDAHSNPNTERGKSVERPLFLGCTLFHLVEKRREDTRARTAEGMAQGYGPTVDISDVGRQPQFSHYANSLSGESLIKLNKADVLYLETQPVQELPRCRYRAIAHHTRVYARNG